MLNRLPLGWIFTWFAFAVGLPGASANERGLLFEGVRIFDGTSQALLGPAHVLVVGRHIQRISDQPIPLPSGVEVQVIDGRGSTLMPGLIDAHTHLMFAAPSPLSAYTADLGYLSVVAAHTAEDMLLRGFTSVRDVGGPVFGLKRAIDQGFARGPRIWPAGAFVSQSGGHGDFRLPNELPARPGQFTFAELVGAVAIADDPDLVRKRVREQLALGASHIKLMAGGGVSSAYDPLDVTQYTPAEIRAAVEAAANWGTYVTVHAYTPHAVRQAVEAGVRCIEHGQLLDEQTAALLAERGVWWSLQPFLDDGDANPKPEGSDQRAKQLEVSRGTDRAFQLALDHGVRLAFGTDTLFDGRLVRRQGNQLIKAVRWMSPARVLRMATADNAQLLALSGPRSPYPGDLGVVREGALADLILVAGDPLADIARIADPGRYFLVIVKDGVVYKNQTQVPGDRASGASGPR